MFSTLFLCRYASKNILTRRGSAWATLLSLLVMITGCETIPTTTDPNVVSQSLENSTSQTAFSLPHIFKNMKAVPPYHVTVVPNLLNLRDLPKGETIGRLAQNDTLLVTAKYRNWGRIYHNKTEGWVHLDYVKATNTATNDKNSDETSNQHPSDFTTEPSFVVRAIERREVVDLHACGNYSAQKERNAWVNTGRRAVLKKANKRYEYAVDEAYFNCSYKPVATTCGTVVRTKTADAPVRFISQGTVATTHIEAKNASKLKNKEFNILWERLCLPNDALLK